jgi:hypothetical protein
MAGMLCAIHQPNFLPPFAALGLSATMFTPP